MTLFEEMQEARRRGELALPTGAEEAEPVEFTVFAPGPETQVYECGACATLVTDPRKHEASLHRGRG